MANETLQPDAELVATNLSGTISDVQEDPDSSTCTNRYTVVTDGGDTIFRCSFPAPSGNLTSGADLQEFRVRFIPTGGNSPDAIDIYLYENGSQVGSVIYNAADPSGEQVVSATWNAADLSDQSGVDVEVHIVGTGDPSPTPQISSVEICAIEWNVDYTPASGTNYERTLSSNIDVTDPQTRQALFNQSVFSNVDTWTAIIQEALYNRIIADNVDISDQIVREILSEVFRQLTASVDVTDDDGIQRIQDITYITKNSITISDAIVKTFQGVFLRTLQSNIEINDSIIRNIAGVYIRTLQSNIEINDSIISTFTGIYARTVQSLVDVNDSIAREVLSETFRILSSSVDVTTGELRRLQDIFYMALSKADVTDGIIRTLQAVAFARTVRSSIDTWDLTSDQRFIETILKTGYDNITTSMSRDILVIVGRWLQSSVDISDLQIRTLLIERLLLSDLTIADSIVRTTTGVQFLERFLQSNIEITDQIIRSVVQFLSRLLTSSVDVNDSMSREVAAIAGRILSSSVDVNDFQIRMLEINRAVDSSVTAADTVARLLLLDRTLSSNVNIYDLIVRELEVFNAVNRILQSNVDLTDQIAVGRWLGRNLFSNTDIFDRIVRSAEYKLDRTLFSGVDIVDFVVRTLNISGDFLERIVQSNVDISADVSRQVSIVRGLVSEIAVLDSIVRDRELGRVLKDNVDIVDAITTEFVLRITRILRDEIAITDDVIADISVLITGVISMGLEGSGIVVDSEQESIVIGIEK